MHRGECAATGGLYRPTHLCVAHLNCTKKFTVFSLVWEGWRVFGEGEGGGGG